MPDVRVATVQGTHPHREGEVEGRFAVGQSKILDRDLLEAQAAGFHLPAGLGDGLRDRSGGAVDSMNMSVPDPPKDLPSGSAGAAPDFQHPHALP